VNNLKPGGGAGSQFGVAMAQGVARGSTGRGEPLPYRGSSAGSEAVP